MWKRILKFTVLGVVILLIVVAGLRWWSLAQLERRLTQLREDGDPVSLTDLAPGPVPPQDNAATYLARVADDAAKLYAELKPILYREDFNAREGLTPDELAAAEEAFQAYPRVMPALEQAANAKSHAWPLDYAQSHTDFLEDYLEVVINWRTFAQVFHCRARYLAASAKPDEAIKVNLQQLRLARLQSRELVLVGFLANTFIRQIAIEGINDVLQTAPLAPATHASIEKELARHDSLISFVQMLKAERVIGIESFGQFPYVLASQWMEYLDCMQNQIEIGARPLSEIEDQSRQSYGTLTALVVPAIESSRNAMNRVRGLSRSVRIVNALVAQDVQDPAVDLATLNLPPDTLVNPFSGEPLTHEKTELGWKVGDDDNDGNQAIKITAEPPPAASP